MLIYSKMKSREVPTNRKTLIIAATIVLIIFLIGIVTLYIKDRH
jgi:hypothetical protein